MSHEGPLGEKYTMRRLLVVPVMVLGVGASTQKGQLGDLSPTKGQLGDLSPTKGQLGDPSPKKGQLGDLSPQERSVRGSIFPRNFS